MQLKLLVSGANPSSYCIGASCHGISLVAKMYADSLVAGYWGGGLWQGPRLLGAAVVSTGAGEAHLLNMCVALDHQAKVMDACC